MKSPQVETVERQYKAEKMEEGKVSYDVYAYYVVNMGFVLFGCCVLFYTLGQVISAGYIQ